MGQLAKSNTEIEDLKHFKDRQFFPKIFKVCLSEGITKDSCTYRR